MQALGVYAATSSFVKQVIAEDPADVDALLATKYENGTIADYITAKVATIGEKITVRRFVRYQAKDSIVEVFTDLTVWLGIRRAIEQVNANAAA